jgi:hypothetical protein
MTIIRTLVIGALGVLLLSTAGNAFVFISGTPRWPAGGIVMQMQLGGSGTLLDGSTSWNASAEGALAAWNSNVGSVEFRVIRDSTAPIGDGDGRNSVFFSDRVFDRSFDDAVAVATAWTRDSGRTRVEADVIFNNAYSWNSYRGPLRASTGGGTLYDLRRVALHEFGHVLGLDHPDEFGQTMVAVMNSTVSDVDGLQSDDIAGARALYSGAPPPPTLGPGQPSVQVNSDNSLVITYHAPTTPPAPGASIAVTLNGATVPGSPFFLGNLTTIRTGPVGPGTYTIQILWGSLVSPVTTFTVSGAPGLGAPSMQPANVVGRTVTLSWTPGTGPVTGYDLEATLVLTGQVFNLPLGNQLSVTVNNVPAGTFIVRVRSRNAVTVSAFSNSTTVVVNP